MRGSVRGISVALPGDLWFADRNFCCSAYLIGLALRCAFFVIRQHAGLPFVATGEIEFKGDSATGAVYEQLGVITNPETKETLTVRRIEVRLKSKTRDGDTKIALITNLFEEVDAIEISNGYRKRWSIETAFQEMESILEGESPGLCYPPAALFSLSVSYVSYNLLQCLTKSIEVSHPHEERKVSSYYVAGEVTSSHHGLMTFTEREDWSQFTKMSPHKMGLSLLQLGRKVNYDIYSQNPAPNRKSNRSKIPRGNHASTAKILNKKSDDSKIP